tara:strand:- start:308 stop:547 length:240 start_codon:yes stop_codon:yes gene_type:complete
MLGIMTITKRGQDKQEAYHQHQDFVVTTMVENVVDGQFLQDQHLQYLKCGAAEHLEQVAVAVCKDIQLTQVGMLLNQQT